MESSSTKKQQDNTNPPAKASLPIFQFYGNDYNHPVITFPGIMVPIVVPLNSVLDKRVKEYSRILISHTHAYKVVEEGKQRSIPPIPYTYGTLAIVRKKSLAGKLVHIYAECTHRVKIFDFFLNIIFTSNSWEIIPEENPTPVEFNMAFYQEHIDVIRDILGSIDEGEMEGVEFIPPDLRNTPITEKNLGVFLDQGAYLLNRFGRLERVAKFLRSFIAEPNVTNRLDLLAAFFNDIRDAKDLFIDTFTNPDQEEETNIPIKTKNTGADIPTKNIGEYERYRNQYLKIKHRLSENVQEEIESALERFQKEGKSHDAKSHLVYLLKLFSLEETRDNIDLVRAKKILDLDHTGLIRPKERVLEHLAVRKYASTSTKNRLCFLGPPGVGKTSLGASIARALGRKFIRFSLGGLHDEAEIKGHSFTYVHTEPGQIVRHLINGGSSNPVFLLDEIDKIGHNVQGDPAAALLELLDPEQNIHFFDHSLSVGFDCSKIFFICTANSISNIPPALLDRMEIIKLSGYTPYEKFLIAKNHLISKVCTENGFPLPQGGGRPHFAISFSNNAIFSLIEKYTAESGVRQLEQLIHEITRKVALRFEKGEFGEEDQIHITEDNIRFYAGKPLIYPEQQFETLPPGCVPMFAVSDVGGHFFYLEVSIRRGHDHRKIKVTGVRGSKIPHDVNNLIEETVDVAFDSLTCEGGILFESFERESHGKECYIHLHVRDESIPKDGPSAGIPILAALYGLFQNKPIQPNLGATGEIDLKLGVIGAVGGIREKALAAYRAGIKRFIIPEDNARDLDEVPEEIKKEIEFLPKRFWWDALLEAFPEDEMLLTYAKNHRSS